jgi:CMP-N-acetylneuraminic acid synthetase
MNGSEVIQQKSLSLSAESSTISVFGKEFDPVPETKNTCIIVHEDFPMLNENDLEEFISYSEKYKKIVISGCRANIHPYRLMYIDDEGYDAFCVDIPQAIRGNRHLYPEIYQFVPALISIPPKMSLYPLSCHENLDMFVMPEEKLLDKTILTERLLISALTN